MFLTLDILERYDACKLWKKWFARNFPDGAELIDVINHPRVDIETLHWGYANLTTTKEEQEAYWSKLKVEVPDRCTIYESDHITNSTYVSRSSNVKDSELVFSSQDVNSSNNILNSKNIERSVQVFGSEFVYDSQWVCQSRNVTGSANIVNADYVVHSNDVMNASTVVDSFAVYSFRTGGTKQIRGSAFITDCVNLKHCLFCANIEGKEYMLFNQPIDQDQFEIIMKQLRNILGDWHPKFVKGEWPEGVIPLDSPVLQRNVMHQFENLPEAFWRWVKTLPGYDPSLLYAITFQADLI